MVDDVPLNLCGQFKIIFNMILENSMHEPIPVVQQAEDNLIDTARKAHQAAELASDGAAVVIGRCVVEWSQQNPGSMLEEFSKRTTISVKSLEQRRDVWKTFGDVIHEYEHLSWSHFREALRWPDATECLTWANENQASKREMSAWRAMQNGEDLTTEPEPTDEPIETSPVEHDPAEEQQPEHEVPFVSDPNVDRTELATEPADDSDIKAARALWRAARNLAVLKPDAIKVMTDLIVAEVKSTGEVGVPPDGVLRGILD